MGQAAAAFANTVTMLVAEKTRRLKLALFDDYHPELHYMRGPGPKWREKHAQPLRQTDLGDFGASGLWNAGA
jgi:hypothetical protein